MRYEKKVIVLSSVLAALLAIWGLGMVFSPERVAARSESAHLISGKSADVASIAIAVPGSAPVELAKSGAAWELVEQVPGASAARFPARAERVSSFLSDLESVSRLRLVARSKDSWAEFKLDESQAKRATLKDASGKVLADLYLGGQGPTGSGLYLRRAASDSSYIVESGLASYLNSGRSEWLDLALLPGVKEADLQSLTIKSDIALEAKKPALKLDYSLRRDGQGWKSGAAQIDAEAAAALIRSIAGIHGEDYIASPPAGAFTKLGASIKLELGNGQSLVLEVGAPAAAGAGPAAAGDRFYARLGERGNVALVSSYSLRACLKSLADLAKR
jgi:hypothetical protein